MSTDKIIAISSVRNQIGSYEKIADLVFDNHLEVCFKFTGHSAFLIYTEGYNGTVFEVSSFSRVFVAEHQLTNLYQVISGTEKIFTTTAAKKSLDNPKFFPVQENEIIRGWHFLDIDSATANRLQFLINKFGSIDHVELFSEFEVELYELKLTRENLFISSDSLKKFLEQPSKKRKSPSGISKNKSRANERILEIADLSWKNESIKSLNQTKLLPMARTIREYLKTHEPDIYKETASNESVKELIRAVAPKYATAGGPPKKHEVELITVNPT
ncbi:hypothetical protein [Acinetobacter baumannii]|uniref:hypothetical protein n=1 Tax=Acinetobacter baumannii TaxID=470 RepID=UPI000F737A0B|nr:hypothetical protein [Acinetobacter baumannii]RSQ72104.1 hypothetical protein EA696_03980 [Acinetobacter baumannii]